MKVHDITHPQGRTHHQRTRGEHWHQRVAAHIFSCSTGSTQVCRELILEDGGGCRDSRVVSEQSEANISAQ